MKKALKIATTIVSALSAVCMTGSMLIACSPKDIKYDKAIAIAKKTFGCERILWIESNALILSDDPDDAPTVNRMRSHYSYYVVGEKAGEEVYIVIPSTPELDKPYITTWAFDYSFTEIVDKFNECGAQYVIDVPDDYYSAGHGSYINLLVGIDLEGMEEAFYESLDVKAVFEYRRVENGFIYDYTVAQIDGELISYERVRAAH